MPSGNELREPVLSLLQWVIQNRSLLPHFAVRQLLHAKTVEELPFKSIVESHQQNDIGRYLIAEFRAGSTQCFLAPRFFLQDLIVELCLLSSGRLVRYVTMMGFCSELMRNVHAKSLAEQVLRLNSVLVELRKNCDANPRKALTQYLA